MYILVPVEQYINDGEYDTDIVHLQQIDQQAYLISEDYVTSNLQFTIKVNGSEYIFLPYTSHYEYLDDCIGFLYSTGTESFAYAIQPYWGEMYTRIDNADDVIRINYHPEYWYCAFEVHKLYNLETEELIDTSGDGEFPYTVINRESGEVTGYIYSEY